MDLKTLVLEIEKKIGLFSYRTIGKKHTYEIPFEFKPAQQLLTGLGGTNDKHALLSFPKAPIKLKGNSDVKITSFLPEIVKGELIIPGPRLDRLLNSGKFHVNTTIFEAGLLKKFISKEQVFDKKAAMPEEVGICHVQEIDLLVDWELDNENGKAIATVRNGTIDVNAPALLLLSSSRLNHKADNIKNLNPQIQNKYIQGMYRNLFQATLSEGRQHIVLCSSELSSHGGKPSLYFNALMRVAGEFPDLNIIYHPGEHHKDFDKALQNAANPANVVRATKNIICIASKLTQDGKLCAIHNPSDSEVLYGLLDIGGYWKSVHELTSYVVIDDKTKTSQANLGNISTAPMNSFLFNPASYEHIIEINLEPPQKLDADASSVESSQGTPQSGTPQPGTPLSGTPRPGTPQPGAPKKLDASTQVSAKLIGSLLEHHAQLKQQEEHQQQVEKVTNSQLPSRVRDQQQTKENPESSTQEKQKPIPAAPDNSKITPLKISTDQSAASFSISLFKHDLRPKTNNPNVNSDSSSFNAGQIQEIEIKKIKATFKGHAIIQVIERLEQGSKSFNFLNPYWINSQNKLDKIVKCLRTLQKEQIDAELERPESELSRAVNMQRFPIFHFFSCCTKNSPVKSRIMINENRGPSS